MKSLDKKKEGVLTPTPLSRLIAKPAAKATKNNIRNCAKGNCRGFVLKDSNYCFAHDPIREAERMEARKKGGRAATAPIVLAEKFPLKTIPEVRDMLERVTNATLNGEIDLGRARIAGYLGSLILACLKDYDLERRMEELEKKIDGISVIQRN